MNTLSIVRIAGALICSTIALPAQTIDLTFVDVSPGLTFSGSFTAPGGFAQRPAGVLNFTGGVVGFCVEPLQPVGGTATYDEQPYNSLTNYDSIAKVLGFYLESPKTDHDAAAAQWAIWEIVGDGMSAFPANTFTTGSIRIDTRASATLALASATDTNARSILNNLSSYPSASFTYATHSTQQNVVLNMTLIPEPSSALLGALSVTALFIRRRR